VPVADQTKDASSSLLNGTGPEDSAHAGQKRSLKWYVVQVYSGFEQKVKLSLA